jgi:hypothetical protein
MKKPKDSKRDTDKRNQSSQKTSTRIVKQLAEDALIPTEREKRLLQDLFDWQERSRGTHWILEQPLGIRAR